VTRSKLKFFSLTIVFLILFLTGCGERDDFEFPAVYISVSINISNDAEFMSLSSPGNSLDIIGHPNGDISLGYDNNGIIVYNSGDYKEPFYAFDRTCPNDLPESIAISSDGSQATCPKCKSVYVLSVEGYPANGSVSKHYLKKYHTSYNPNSGELIISN
jgi:hypothetical protein